MKKTAKKCDMFQKRTRVPVQPYVTSRHACISSNCMSATFTSVGRIGVLMIFKATLDRVTHTRQVSGEG